MKRINSFGYILTTLTIGMALSANAATVRVTGGAWNLGNKLSATNFVLGSAASISGNGEVRSPATLAGTISPGSSVADIGSLAFSDSVAFNAGSFVCHAATDTSLDRISATGNVSGAATVNMTRAAAASPLRQIIIKAGAASDYAAFTVSPSSEWALDEMGALDLVVSLGQLPPAPQNVAASDGTYDNRVALTWSAASGATGYQVWRNTANDSSAATMLGAASGLAYNDNSAGVNALYYYWVKATNIIGTGAFSSSDSGWRSGISSGVCADYDGDGLADPAVYDEATGTWKARLSSEGYLILREVDLGGPGYASVSADYDGDGKADPAVYQELTGEWIFMLSTLGYTTLELWQTFGGPGYSGMPADYDGDVKADPGVYQRTQGDWKVLLSTEDYDQVEASGFLGGTGYRAVAADYDGDGKADPAVYGEDTGDWKVRLSGAGYQEYDSSVHGWSLGGTGYIPVPADYDGDGKADPAVRSETGNEWIGMLSSRGYFPPVEVSLDF